MARSNMLALGGAGTSLIVATALLLGGSAGAAQAPPKSPGPAKAAPGTANIAGTAVSVPPGSNSGPVTVTCPAGTLVTGGGGTTSGVKIFFTDSFRTGNGWTIRGTNTNTVAESITAVAVCAGVS